MSIRAGLVSFFLRRTIKKQMADLDDPVMLREKLSRAITRLPDNVRSDKIEVRGVPANWVYQENSDSRRVVLYLHGGGYVFGGYGSHGEIASKMASLINGKTLLLEYSLAPENPFPAAIEDALIAYRWLLEGGTNASDIVLAGDSAGGGLSVALLLQLKRAGLGLPRAVCLFSPWVDLTCSSDSIKKNESSDCMLSPRALERFKQYYLGESDSKNELVSPIFGDLSGLPPTYVAVGSNEILLDDARTLVSGIKSSGGVANLSIWQGMPHVFPIMSSIIPEGRQVLKEFSGFLEQHT